MKNARRRVEERLSRFAIRCAEAGVASKELETVGVPAPEIAKEAQRFDLIILPRQGQHYHPHASGGFGASLWRILHQASRPVVAVPERATPGIGVAIAYDGSLQAARALQLFEASGLASIPPVHVICLNDNHLEAARCGQRAVDFLDHHGIHARLHTGDEQGDIASAIYTQAAALGVGLLVMGAYSESRLQEYLLGSVTRSVIAHSNLPLFLYH